MISLRPAKPMRDMADSMEERLPLNREELQLKQMSSNFYSVD